MPPPAPTNPPILPLQLQHPGMPSYAYQVGEYRVEKDGTLTGPADERIKAKLREIGSQEA